MSSFGRPISGWRQSVFDYAWITYLGLSRAAVQAALPDAFAGTALGLFVATGPTRPYLWALGFLLLLAITGITRRLDVGNKLAFSGMLALFALSVVGAATAITLHSGDPAFSVSVAMWLSIMLLLVVLPLSEQALLWTVPAILVHAGITFGQGAASILPRAVGITANPNIAGGLLVVGVALLTPTRYRYWALPLAASLVFTGSRLALMVLTVLLVLAALRHSWRFSLAVTGAVLLTVLLFMPQVAFAFRLEPLLEAPRQIVTRAIAGRVAPAPYTNPVIEYPSMKIGLPATPYSSLRGTVPLGYSGDDGIHNVPARLWVELGAVGAILWTLLTWHGLTHRLWSPAWWVLLALTGLSTLDYYTWVPLSVSAFWWIAVKLQGKSS